MMFIIFYLNARKSRTTVATLAKLARPPECSANMKWQVLTVAVKQVRAP